MRRCRFNMTCSKLHTLFLQHQKNKQTKNRAVGMKVDIQNKQVNFTFRQTAHPAAEGLLTSLGWALLLFDFKD